MTSAVTRLKPRSGSYENALDAFRAGAFLSAAEMLSSCATPAAVALRVRALQRAGELPGALAILENYETCALSNPEAGELLLSRAYALNLLRRPHDAAVVAVEARARVFSGGVAALECELHFSLAMGAWIDGHRSAVLSELAAALAVTERPRWLASRHGYPYSLGLWRARACELRATLERADANHKKQVHWMRQAFDELDRGGDGGTWLEASMLANFAVISVDIELSEVMAFTQERAARLPWNPFTARQEHFVFGALGRSLAMHGDHLGALRCLRRSAEAAPSAPLRMRSTLDRSFLMREIGEIVTAKDEIECAKRAARTVDWESEGVFERCSLALLAEHLAPFDLPEAQRLLKRYDALRPPVSIRMIEKPDERIHGDELCAHAAVARAAGDDARAVGLFADALAIWTELDFTFRAAVAAANLAELTGEARYIDIAAREAQKRPNSWLARKVAKVAV